MSRLPRLLAAALAGALVLAGCGAKDEPEPTGASGRPLEKLTLVLDYFPNADHAPIYAAQASGEFRRAGLDVELQAPPDPSAPLKLLRAGRADVVISYEPELLLARDQGLEDLVGVGALVQGPLTSIISLPGGRVTRPADLAGKRVGTAGLPYQAAYLRQVLRDAGRPADSARATNVGFNLVPALLGKRVDATLGAFWNYEGTQLRRERRNPRIIRIEDAGVPRYDELVFVADRDTLNDAGANRLRRFLQAVGRGAEGLRSGDGRKEAIDALMEDGDDLDRGLQEAVVDATLPVFFPEDEDLPWGTMEPRDWARYGEWMFRNDLLETRKDAGRALTNEFLAGQGLDDGVAGLDEP